MQDREFIKRGLGVADLDAVKITLFHHTRDDTLEELPLAANMTPDQREALIDRAADWLLDKASDERLPAPSPSDMRRMMEMATGAPIGDVEYNARHEIAGFDDYPYFARWDGDRPDIPDGFKVAVIGSGFAGIGMAVQLDILGIEYSIFERRAEAGGVWSINNYPDVRVDTMSVTYELPFEREFHWKEYFGRGSDVRQHLDAVSRKFGVHDHTRFAHDVQEARWDSDASLWHLTVKTPDGIKQFTANAIVSCSGTVRHAESHRLRGPR